MAHAYLIIPGIGVRFLDADATALLETPDGVSLEVRPIMAPTLTDAEREAIELLANRTLQRPPSNEEILGVLKDIIAADQRVSVSSRLNAPIVDRLIALLGLSDAERVFVNAALTVRFSPVGQIDILSVFADYLEDAGKHIQAARVRKLIPRDGDILLFSNDSFAGDSNATAQLVTAFQERLDTAGIRAVVFYARAGLDFIEQFTSVCRGIREKIEIEHPDLPEHAKFAIFLDRLKMAGR